MADRIVLLLAYHFPPENSVGGVRPYYFCKYLSRMGYECHVITAAEQGGAGEPGWQYVADPFVTRPRAGLGWQVERALRKIFVPGVTGIRWSRRASQAAYEFLQSRREAEITIYSTYPPLGTHLAAFLLKRRTGFKWIADYRDPLSGNPSHIGLTNFQEDLHGWMDRVIAKNADAVVANTDSLEERFRSVYPQYRSRVHLIWNGFDPEDRMEDRPLPQRSFKLLTHTGELYGGRDITPLLHSVGRLIDSGRLKASEIRIRLIGPYKNDSVPSPEFLQRATEQGWLELIPEYLPRSEARRMAKESDGLLLVQPHSSVQVPSKLFEYLRMGRPILAFILPNTPIERILSQSGVPYRCVYAGSSDKEIDAAVQGFIGMESDASAANDWFQENFDAQRQTETLEAVIRSLHGR